MKKITTLALIIVGVSKLIASPLDTTGFHKATLLYDGGKLQEAQEILLKIETGHARYAPLYYYIGLVKQDLSQLDEAEKYYKKAIEIDPKYSDPYSDLASIKISQKKYDEAKKYSETAIKNNPKFVNGYINLASAYAGENQMEKASEIIIKAAQIDYRPITNIGTTYLKDNNDPQSAIFYFSAVLKSHPEDGVTELNMGNAYRMLNNNEEAIKVFEVALIAVSKDDEAYGIIYSSYFRVLLDGGQCDKILDNIFKYTNKENGNAYFFKALAEYKKGLTSAFETSAKKYFELSKETEPTSLSDWAASLTNKKK